jgi:hypothetical protein
MAKLGLGPLAQFYHGSEQMDRPVNLYLATRLHAWELRVNASTVFYPNGFMQPPVFRDRFFSALMNTATTRCLACIGRNEEATCLAEKAHGMLKSLKIRPLTYTVSIGLALMKALNGDLQQAMQFAKHASALASTSRQRADVLSITGYINGLTGNSNLAKNQIHQARREAGYLSTIMLHLCCTFLIISGTPLQEVEAFLDRESTVLTDEEDQPDRYTILRFLSMYLDYRKCVEGQFVSPDLLLEKSINIKTEVDRHWNSFFLRTCMEYNIARAASLVATTTADISLKKDALWLLGNAERLARLGAYRIQCIDTWIARSKLFLEFKEFGHAHRDAINALDSATALGYTFGISDANKILHQIQSG